MLGATAFKASIKHGVIFSARRLICSGSFFSGFEIVGFAVAFAFADAFRAILFSAIGDHTQTQKPD